MKAWLVGEQLEQSGEHVNCGRREHVKETKTEEVSPDYRCAPLLQIPKLAFPQ